MSLIGSEPQLALLSAQGIRLAQLFHLLLLCHLNPQDHLPAQQSVAMILARHVSFHLDIRGSSTMPAPLSGMLLKIPSHGVLH